MSAMSMAVVAVALALGATGTAIPAREAPKTGAAEDCPFTYENMSRTEVLACQAYFAAGAPDGRFEPGSPSFSTRFCGAHERHAVCQQVRVAVCRFAVGDGGFPSIRSCLSATPGARQVVHRRSPRASVILFEPWYLENGRLWIDNEVRSYFPDDGFIDFQAATPTAWDSRSGRIVPFPRDLVRFIARSPYVRVLRIRTVRLAGVTARQIDVVARQGDPRARRRGLCGEVAVRDEPCLPITADDAAGEGYVSLSLEPGEPNRLTDLRTRSGRLIIHITQFDRFTQLSGAERILGTLRIG